jgi:hypothetical protein
MTKQQERKRRITSCLFRISSFVIRISFEASNFVLRIFLPRLFTRRNLRLSIHLHQVLRQPA